MNNKRKMKKKKGKNTSCNLGVSRWRLALFAPNRPLQLRWRNSCICPRKRSMLEASQFSTMFSCENGVSFERNISCTSELSK
jgi:hypothetical protein